MPWVQLEFPFEYSARPVRQPICKQLQARRLPRSRKAVPRRSRDEITIQAVKSKAVRKIIAAVDAVSIGRDLVWEDVVFFHPKESAAVTEARELAIALCAWADVSLCIVARLFHQPWAMVWEAENSIATRCKEHSAMGVEWESYLESPAIKAATVRRISARRETSRA